MAESIIKNVIDEIRPFMHLNGFIVQEDGFINEFCAIKVEEEGYAVIDNDGCMYSDNHQIYWLIGYLTYSGYLPKDYKQP